MRRESCDLLVAGGGPAGTTLATLLKRRHPKRRVILLERESFPRHHIGESTLPGMRPILSAIGALEAVERAGFVPKTGARYRWGGRPPLEVGFRGRVGTAWQVRRSVYDKILLDRARACGVEVRERWAASRPLLRRGRLEGLEARGPAGGEVRLEAGVTADCTGQDGLFARFFPVRRAHPGLRNIAVYAYYRGNPRLVEGLERHGGLRILVRAAAEGWLWFIPLSREVVSIGLVRKLERLRPGSPPRDALESAVRSCPEFGRFFSAARLIPRFDGSARDVHLIRDYSFESLRGCGEGWIAAGDAAYFVDPILSMGVLLAHLSAARAACGIGLLWEDPVRGEALWKDYDLFLRQVSTAVFAMALFWYGREPNAAGWTRLAARLLPGGRTPSAADLEAFVRLTAGHRLFGAATEPDFLGSEALAALQAAGGRPRAGLPRGALRPPPDSWRPRLRVPYELRDSSLMDLENVTLRPALKMLFPTLPLSPLVTGSPFHAASLARCDGRGFGRLARELAEEFSIPVPHARWLAGDFLRRLARAGILPPPRGLA